MKNLTLKEELRNKGNTINFFLQVEKNLKYITSLCVPVGLHWLNLDRVDGHIVLCERLLLERT